MMRPAIELQEKGEAYYFIADYHSMTSITDPEVRRKNSLDVALDFLACGLDPAKSVFFMQSEVPEVTELTWLLGTVTPMSLLERCHAYKDKTAKGLAANFGLFAYPVLMASDILIYDSNIVPVGRDQKQHVEVTRDIAIKFNQLYGEVFVIPEPQIRDEVAVVPGTDGQKMSKSYDNTIEIFGEEKPLRKKIMRLVMDSRPPEEPKPDADKNIAIQLLKLVGSKDTATDYENRLREAERRSYHYCSQGKSKKQARKECLAPGYSSSFGYNGFGGSGNFNCGSDYDRCFTDICGGTIRRIVEQP